MKQFWILWQPGYHEPPRVRFKTREDAEETAKECAGRWNKPVYVLLAESLFEREDPPVSKTTLKRGAK